MDVLLSLMVFIKMLEIGSALGFLQFIIDGFKLLFIAIRIEVLDEFAVFDFIRQILDLMKTVIAIIGIALIQRNGWCHMQIGWYVIGFGISQFFRHFHGIMSCS